MFFPLDALIILLVIGFLAGLLANVLTGRRSSSTLSDVMLGILGAGVGNLLMALLGLYTRGGFVASLFSATLGAVVLIWFYRRFMESGRS